MYNKEFNYIRIALIFLIIGSLAFPLQLGALKYIRFATPLLLILLPAISTRSNKDLKEKALGKIFTKKLFVFYVVLIAITLFTNSLVFSMGLTYRNFVNFIFLLSPVFACYCINNHISRAKLNKLILFLFYAFTCSYLIELAYKGVSIGTILSIFGSNVVVDSDFDTESGSSLIFGFFAIYFFHHKNFRLLAIAFLLVFLGAKRIAIFGTAISLVSMMVYPALKGAFLKENRKGFYVFFCVVMFLIALFWTFIFSGKYDDLIYELTGKSSNAFFMGRLNRISTFFDHLPDESNYLVGYGIGYAENIFYYLMDLPTPFHNDFYRFFLEFGPVLFVVWCYLMIKYASRNAMAFGSFILLLLLMQTDNAFTYEVVMYPYYLVTLYSFRPRKRVRKHHGPGEAKSVKKPEKRKRRKVFRPAEPALAPD